MTSSCSRDSAFKTRELEPLLLGGSLALVVVGTDLDCAAALACAYTQQKCMAAALQEDPAGKEEDSRERGMKAAWRFMCFW
jgi:hypothetical protein